MKKILVTGGAGYIGSHTVVELQNEGYEVHIIDNLSNSQPEVLEGIRKITGVLPQFKKFDLTDAEAVFNFFRQNEIDAVIHFAAYKAVGESVREPAKYYRNNLVSLLNLLEAMEQHSCSCMVFSSSCTVYGQPDSLPVTEQSPVKEALSPYGNTKQISEEIIRDVINSKQKMKAISLRYFNPIGAHESAIIGELPTGVPDNLVPFITQTAIGIREQLSVFGNDYDTPDGSCIRDYIHVVDLSKAHVSAVKRLFNQNNKHNFEIFNLGTGQGTSVFEIIDTFEKVTGVKLNYKKAERRPGDVACIYADASLANRELGWKAEKSMEETLLSAWNWEKQLRNRTKQP